VNTAANPCTAALVAWATAAPTPQRPWAVAFSGGADSTALLLAAHTAWPGAVKALHVHHGLQAAADGFEQHVRAQCESWGVPCLVQRIQAQHAPGQSPEAAARAGRYLALAEMAQAVGAQQVLLGHHADDQVETLMLALSRGAGLPGLSAMPLTFERHGVCFARPMLSVDPQTLRDWLQASGIPVVQDPSNDDVRFTRNRIRHGLLAAWRRDFPAYAQTLARSAAHAAQAQTLLDDLAHIDLNSVGVPPSISALQALSCERQGNAIRHWLRNTHCVAPSQAQLETLLQQIAACTTRAHRIELKVAGGLLTRQGQHLHYAAPL